MLQGYGLVHQISFGLWGLEHFGEARGVFSAGPTWFCVQLSSDWTTARKYIYFSCQGNWKVTPLQAVRVLSLSKLVTVSEAVEQCVLLSIWLWSPQSMSPAVVSIGLSTSKSTEGPSPKCSHLLPTLNEHFGGLDNYYNCNVLKSSFKSSGLIHVDRNLPGKYSVYTFWVLKDSQSCWKAVLPHPTPHSFLQYTHWRLAEHTESLCQPLSGYWI